MIPWLLARVERLLDRRIRESVSASARLDALEGRSLRVTVDGLALDCVLAVEGGRLRISPATARHADAVVRGTPLDLSRLLGPDMAARVHGSGVTVKGRVQVAEAFAELLRVAAPDPEEELSRWVGDLAAYRLGRAARGAAAWAGKAAEALRLDTVEYLTEESGTLPTRYEAEAFFAAVERLRDDVERAAERVERLSAASRPSPAGAESGAR